MWPNMLNEKQIPTANASDSGGLLFKRISPRLQFDWKILWLQFLIKVFPFLWLTFLSMKKYEKFMQKCFHRKILKKMLSANENFWPLEMSSFLRKTENLVKKMHYKRLLQNGWGQTLKIFLKNATTYFVCTHGQTTSPNYV